MQTRFLNFTRLGTTTARGSESQTDITSNWPENDGRAWITSHALCTYPSIHIEASSSGCHWLHRLQCLKTKQASLIILPRSISIILKRKGITRIKTSTWTDHWLKPSTLAGFRLSWATVVHASDFAGVNAGFDMPMALLFIADACKDSNVLGQN